MFRKLAVAALALVVVAVPTVANAAKGGGGGGGSKTAAITISWAGSTGAAITAKSWGSQVSFAVNEPSTMSLWVSNTCTQNGVAVYAENEPVYNDVAGPFTLSSSGTGSATCTAYVWAFPDAFTPIPGASLTYTTS